MYTEIEESIENELGVECESDERDFLMETMLEEKVASSAKQFDWNILNIIRCGAHILALVIEDTLKQDEESKKKLNLARKVAKKMRTPNLMLKLKERNALKPILDVPTRWGSSYDMLERLLVLKSIIRDFGSFIEDFDLSAEDWLGLELLKNDMEAPRRATIHFQDRHMTAGALLAEWELMECICERHEGSLFSFNLKVALLSRKCTVLHNAFLGAVYVDLRYHRLLSLDQKECDQKHILSTWRRMVILKNYRESPVSDPSPPEASMNPETGDISDCEDPLEALLIQKDSEAPLIQYNDRISSEKCSFQQSRDWLILPVFQIRTIYSDIGPTTPIRI